jgi:hypothetical protein
MITARSWPPVGRKAARAPFRSLLDHLDSREAGFLEQLLDVVQEQSLGVVVHPAERVLPAALQMTSSGSSTLQTRTSGAHPNVAASVSARSRCSRRSL